MRAIRLLLLLEAATFVGASLIHQGVLVGGYRHQQASVAEAVIAIVLACGLLLTWTPIPWARRAAIGSQAFGIVGVLVGLFTIAIGVGPRSGPDLVYHGGILATLIAGLAIAWRRTASSGGV